MLFYKSVITIIFDNGRMMIICFHHYKNHSDYQLYYPDCSVNGEKRRQDDLIPVLLSQTMKIIPSPLPYDRTIGESSIWIRYSYRDSA